MIAPGEDTMKGKKTRAKMSRRQFLGTTAAATGIIVVPRYVLGGPGFVAPSEKVNIALIGAGGQGRNNTLYLFNEPTA